MDNAKIRAWWASLGFTDTSPSSPEDDLADMGTAFGLDASMEPAESRAQTLKNKGRTVSGAPPELPGLAKPRLA
jgi:hypothetical protein